MNNPNVEFTLGSWDATVGENLHKKLYKVIVKDMANKLCNLLSKEDGVGPELDALPVDELRQLKDRIDELIGNGAAK